MLIENGSANLEAKKFDGTTPLYWASRNGHLDVIEYLIEQGANIDASDFNGRTSMWIASFYGHTDVVAHLINKGANVKYKN